MSDLPTRSDTRPRKFPYLPVTWVLYFILFCILTVDSCRDEYERWIMGKAGIGVSRSSSFTARTTARRITPVCRKASADTGSAPDASPIK